VPHAPTERQRADGKVTGTSCHAGSSEEAVLAFFQTGISSGSIITSRIAGSCFLRLSVSRSGEATHESSQSHGQRFLDSNDNSLNLARNMDRSIALVSYGGIIEWSVLLELSDGTGVSDEKFQNPATVKKMTTPAQ
jgi:hypothetical protein